MDILDNQVEEYNQEESESDSLVSVSDTAIIEYLEVVKSEYENERNKKQSFENRAGLILAFLGAICIFVFEQVKISTILELMELPMNFFILVKIVSGIFVYMCFLYTMIMVIKTIVVKMHNNFEVKNIDDPLIFEERIRALLRITFSYRDIIIQHRENNEVRALTFRNSLYGVAITIVSIVTYVSIII